MNPKIRLITESTKPVSSRDSIQSLDPLSFSTAFNRIRKAPPEIQTYRNSRLIAGNSSAGVETSSVMPTTYEESGALKSAISTNIRVNISSHDPV